MRTDRPNIDKTHDDDDDDDDATPSSSAVDHCWDDDLLYRVAVDPFELIATSGRDEGRTAGLRDGYHEGLDIGTSKGWEIGLELGYYHSFARRISHGIRERRSSSSSSRTTMMPGQQQQRQQQRTAHRSERCRTLAGDISRMIDAFPDPDSLLSLDDNRPGLVRHAVGRAGRAHDTSSSSSSSSSSSDGGLFARDGDAMIGSSSDCDEAAMPTSGIDPVTATMLDVSASLERIRSKFRLLCILLRTEQSFDLRRVLESGDGSGGGGADDGGLDRRRGMNGTDAASTSLDDTPVDNAGHGKLTSPGALGSVANGKSSSTLESDW
jgi:hypothetical protein